ncbi:uncharacterized protein LOC118419464 [Branchiostoma floridae]|uniref:Uncharacterized protein LOC118419464 n=1 Tax=Branchiostoma floridae TaxID=7739 RepID=A0A9J7MUJ2_BRAFL|nr:uncharacterized protein LOC118419464 [Branchiostoma floridae]
MKPPSEGHRHRAAMYRGPVTLPCVLIQVLDAIILLVIIAALILACWAGLWKVIDILLFPKDKELTGWTCLAIGMTLQLILNFFQKIFYDTTRNVNLILYGFLWRLHAYVGLIAALTLWRGVWTCLEFYTGESALSLAVSAIIAAVILIPLRLFNVVVTVPGRMVKEPAADPFKIPTRFQIAPSCNCKFVLDVLFNVIVISVLFVVYFRGVFDLMEKVVYPGDKVRNLWACMMIGYGVLVPCVVAQRYVAILYRALADRLWLKIALDDTYSFVIAFGVVNVWRGWWELYDVYLLATGDQVLRGALLHLAGVLVSYLLYASRAQAFPLGPERLDGSLDLKTDNIMGMYLEDKQCCCFEPFQVTYDVTDTRPQDRSAAGQEAEDIMLVVTEEETWESSLNKKAGTGYGSTPGH